MMRPGFIGTGTIAAAMVEGLGGGAVLSPRGARIAAELAARLPDVTVAESNQAVVDACQLVVLAVRSQVAEAAIRALRFRPGQKIVSLIAATRIETIRDWIGMDLPVIRAIPLPSVAERRCLTPIVPADADAAAMFDRLGRSVDCHGEPEFELLAVGSALMGTYFGMLELAQAWLVERGLPEATARDYMAGVFANLGRVAETSDRDFAALREEHSTRGGLNEQMFRVFGAEGGTQAMRTALEAVLARVRGVIP